MERDAIPQPALEQVKRLQGADLILGILGAGGNGRSVPAGSIRAAVEALPHPPRTLLVLNDGDAAPHLENQEPFPVLFCRLSDPWAPGVLPQNVFDAYLTIFGVSGRIEARACAVIASDLDAITPQRIDALIRPLLETGFDLVAPRYPRHKWEGLLNRSIFSPLNQALYGKRIQNPMGPDLGLSGKLMRSLFAFAEGGRPASSHPLASIVSGAVRGNFQICEAHLGARRQPPPDWINLGSLLAQVLGPVFFDIERNAPVWQRIRGTQAVPVFGDAEPAPEESGPVDAQRLLESFQLGAVNLQDIWSVVLPPTTLLEIRKLSRLAPAEFRMPDELWVSVVYDFALAHHVRSINRDHLLRSFTPLYLGWIGSYARQVETADAAAVDLRLERLGRAFEAAKPYLMSRWRWPDRFNP